MAEKKKKPGRIVARSKPASAASKAAKASRVQGSHRPRADSSLASKPPRPTAGAAISDPRPADLTVVGVGASAGGLEAFSQLLRELPTDAGLAVIFVQHLAPTHESMLSVLLSENTSMKVVQIVDGVAIEANRIYVIAPNTQLEIRDGRLHLTERPPDGQFRPIDLFFRSLAEYAGERTIGVVLSGTNSDGADGLREIKAVGGITFAQEPQTAKYDGMPRAAIATDAVDRVLPPEEIAHELGRIARDPRMRYAPAARNDPDHGEADPKADEGMPRIFTLLRQVSGVDFTHYKQPTIRRRMQRRMVLHRITAIAEYLKFLQQNPVEVAALYQDILIHVTRFFRDPESFAAMREGIFPQIVTHRAPQQPIRAWVPGCSTGEEAYSLAIAMLEFLGDEADSPPIQVFATDVSEGAVERARAGIYPESITADVSTERLRRYFSKVDHSYRISKRVRDMCIFARQDLTRDPPFSKLDLIVCRNVLIYLGPVLQKRLMAVFHYALKPTGFLVVGGSESIGANIDLFAPADKKHKFYVRKPSASRPNVEIPAAASSTDRPEGNRKPAPGARAGGGVQNEANRIVLARYAPPGVIVNEDLQITQFRGQTGPFLEPAPGDASLHLLKMAREGLLFDLRDALAEARKTARPARRSSLRIQRSGKAMEVNIEVSPIIVSGDERHYLVVFDEVTPPALPAAQPARTKRGTKQKTAARSDKDGLEHLARLQQELAASRDYLQSIIQDLEAANEELQSANEEILSSNEELQSTNEELDTAKEELQSTNEELNTLNEELQSRNEELSRANSDMVNLLSSVQIAIVMVSIDLRIRRFTPMAEKVLNLIPSDLGRPISDIKPNIDCADLEDVIGECIDHMRIIERQVRDRHGHLYLMRVRPYKSLENKIDGAVVALFDIEAGRRTDAESESLAEYRALLEAVAQPVLVLDGELRVRAMTRAFSEQFKIIPDEAEGRLIYAMDNGHWDSPELRALLEQVLAKEGRRQGSSAEGEFGAGRRRLRISVRRGNDADGIIVMAVYPAAPGEGRS